MYPEFKEVTLEDKELVESITKRFLPYCDFNFSNIYNWSSPKNPTRFSILNNNLVIKMKNFTDETEIVSFIGDTELINTIDTLLNEFTELSMIPSECIPPEFTEDARFIVEEDINNHDYIVSAQELVELKGNKYKTKRHWVKTFLKNCPVKVEVITSPDAELTRKILLLTEKWSKVKNTNVTDESHALERLLFTYHVYNLLFICMFDDGELIGFATNEIVRPEYAIGSFGKAIISYKGIYQFLEHTAAKTLFDKGIKYLNIEQDLGKPGLRESKRSYRPVTLLKKYKIRRSGS
ncbi:hypothetical protein A3K42_00760 [candidate division WWE3 bacterium RBG_13_37_7]|uniref:Phosphatidylglycerol lysyltransferase C-terminal domain-containing protein n=1 Tax=candidate division WWE3 bacterium RBG_13_37_7 TaxID=1802609 RepID=A0A1F4U0M3_UNCKA|nr:MAG: hypothetical protein A3K42_00760 [candidate division WWE3 bacterium RBG_13_37_7]